MPKGSTGQARQVKVKKTKAPVKEVEIDVRAEEIQRKKAEHAAKIQAKIDAEKEAKRAAKFDIPDSDSEDEDQLQEQEEMKQVLKKQQEVFAREAETKIESFETIMARQAENKPLL